MTLCKLCGNELIKTELDNYAKSIYYMETSKGVKYDICAACAFDDEIRYQTGRYSDDNTPKPTDADRSSFVAGISRANQSSTFY